MLKTSLPKRSSLRVEWLIFFWSATTFERIPFCRLPQHRFDCSLFVIEETRSETWIKNENSLRWFWSNLLFFCGFRKMLKNLHNKSSRSLILTQLLASALHVIYHDMCKGMILIKCNWDILIPEFMFLWLHNLRKNPSSLVFYWFLYR